MSFNVLHIIGGGEIGGAERHILNLLTNIDKSRFNPYLLCLHPNAPFAEVALEKGIPTINYHMYFGLDFRPLFKLKKFCSSNKIGLIHCHGLKANLTGRLAGKFLDIPCISTVHSFQAYDYSSPLKANIADLTERITIGFTAGIITISDNLKIEITSRYLRNRNIPVQTIYNGCPSLPFKDKRTMRLAFREKWAIPQEAVVVGTIARLHPVKGIFTLIQALNLLVKEIPNLHFLLVGEGSLYEQIDRVLASSPFSYTMTGYLPEGWKSLPAMDLFVLPSVSEGMGLVVLEAIQAEVPVLATAVGGVPELIRDGTDGLLVSPADPGEMAEGCKHILYDEKAKTYYVQNAKTKLCKFTIDRMVSDTMDFYDKVLN